MAPGKGSSLSIDKTRRLVILSIWAAVLLGLPLWWKTTRVYRAALPFEAIERWSDWKTCEPTFPIKVRLHISNPPSSFQLAVIKDQVAAGFEDLGAGYSSKATFPASISVHEWSGSKEQDVNDRPSTEHGTYDFYISPSDSMTAASIKSQRQGFIQVQSWQQDAISSTVVSTLGAIFAGEKEAIQRIVNADKSMEKVKNQLRAVKYAPGYQLTFSLFSGDASNGVREWKMQEAINAYLGPFLRSMSVISKFTIESQVQHYASLAFQPQVDADANVHYLTPDSLPNFINAAEWSLASTVSSLPSLNFLTYIPKPSESPLVIKEGPSMPALATNSFLIPRWGGITILNRDNETATLSKVISVLELEPIMKIVQSQLRDLMGLTDLSLQRQATSFAFPIHFQSTANGAPTTWELDNLMRRRIAENFVDSIGTLRSLARLVADTPNMVVLDHIQKEVVEALNDVAKGCCLDLRHQMYVSAMALSRQAVVKSEAAFFDPTMVSMLYFPDEHKYAIYMPLFVPISVPLIMSLLREVKKAKDAKKEALKKKKEEEENKVKVE